MARSAHDSAPRATATAAAAADSSDSDDAGSARATNRRRRRAIIDNARAAASKEQSMTLLQGLRLYPKAVAWSLLISTCIAMEGYDISLVNNFYAFPQFQRKYGVRLADGSYQVPPAWQAGLSNGAQVGEIIGLFVNGFVSERFGYRRTVLACLALVAALTAVFFTAPNVQTLLVAEVLCGVPWGVFQTLTVTYASEVCPVALRGYLTTYVNFCWGLGQEIGIGVLRAMLRRGDEWAFRIPYALQWVWPLPLFVGVCFAPESPWWLVRRGRLQDARRSLLRLTSRRSGSSGLCRRGSDGAGAADADADAASVDADETLAMMVHTTALEARLTAGATYWDCFRGVDLRRTEIVCVTWAIQNLSGNSFSNYSTYFLTQAGLPEAASYSFALGQYAINMAGVLGAWGLMSLGAGRRALYLYGLCGLCALLLALGLLGLAPERHRPAASLATGCVMMVWALVYQLTVGTVCYSLVSELSSRRLQIKTVVLGRNLYVVGIITGVLTPYMLNPLAWNWRNFAGFFWAGICFLCIVYTYFRLPEPRGRTFAELDLLFEQRVPARRFASTRVDVFRHHADALDDDDADALFVDAPAPPSPPPVKA